ncbi:flavoprotein [Streptomyces sp. NPDC004838]
MHGGEPVLYVVACGGYPAEDLPRFVDWALDQAWRVCVVTTPKGRDFVDSDALRKRTGFPVRHDYKQPDEPDVLPPADVLVVAPATFNTVNKISAGISDTLALGLVNEAIGLGRPVVVAPWPNKALATRRPFRESVERLRSEGVRFVLDDGNLPEPASGRPGAAAFPWTEVRAETARLRRTFGG